MKKYALSKSPTRQNEYRRWFKSIKSTAIIGGQIVANAYGSSQLQAEERAKIIVDALNRHEADREY